MAAGQFTYTRAIGSDAVWGFPVRRLLLARMTRAGQFVQIVEGEHGRTLFIDGEHQSSEVDEWCYHEALVHPALAVAVSPPERVLILGGGEGGTLREALRWRGVPWIDMVDIDHELIDICREYLPKLSAGAFDDRRGHLYTADAAEWVHDRRVLIEQRMTKPYDAIIIDLCEPSSETVLSCHTPEFFADVAALLAPGGALTIQAGPIHNLAISSFQRTAELLRPNFADITPYLVAELRWSFFLARKVKPTDELRYWSLPPGLRYIDQRFLSRLGAVPAYLADLVWP